MITSDQIVEDSKVVSAGAGTIWLQYSNVLNETLTLFISLCTAIYVGRKAYKTIKEIIKTMKKKKKGGKKCR